MNGVDSDAIEAVASVESVADVGDRFRQIAVEPRAIKAGDVVRLAAGSMAITVSEVISAKGSASVELCRCVWFDGGKLAEGLVPSVALRLVEEKA